MATKTNTEDQVVTKTTASADETAYFMAKVDTTWENNYIPKKKVISAKRSALAKHPCFVEVTADTVESTAKTLEKKVMADPGTAFKTQQKTDKLKAQLAVQKQALV